MFTVVALLIYLICSRLPLYGIRTSQSADPMYWIRVIFASSRGTTMELGISPVVTSGLVIQLLVGSKLLDIDTSVKSDMDLMYASRPAANCIEMRPELAPDAAWQLT
jgi:protein transport protein SEC61 subunit alpha